MQTTKSTCRKKSATTGKKKQIKIIEEFNVAEAAYEAKDLAEEAGCSISVQFMISTAVSELARNIHLHATRGEVTVRIIKGTTKNGIEIIAEDKGPGIEDIGMAMKDYFSTGEGLGLGLGLGGVKRLMDEFLIDAERKVGTKITARKWVNCADNCG